MKAYSFYFNASDWLSSPAVKQMSLAERGAYIGLLAFAWNSERPGTLPASPDKVRRIAEMSPAEWAESGEALLEKFPLSECQTYRYNPRLMAEVGKEKAKSEKAAASANKRWQSERNANASNTDANASKNDATPSIAQEQVQVKNTITPDAEPASPSPAVSKSGLPPVEPCHLTAQKGGKQLPAEKAAGPGFDEFWQAFGKKEDKHKAGKAWAALNADQRTAALAGVPTYVAGTPDKRYRKNPLTWLNGKCWLDEETPAARAETAPLPQPSPQLAPPAPAPAVNHAFVAEQEAAQAAAVAAHLSKFSQPLCNQPQG